MYKYSSLGALNFAHAKHEHSHESICISGKALATPFGAKGHAATIVFTSISQIYKI